MTKITLLIFQLLLFTPALFSQETLALDYEMSTLEKRNGSYEIVVDFYLVNNAGASISAALGDGRWVDFTERNAVGQILAEAGGFKRYTIVQPPSDLRLVELQVGEGAHLLQAVASYSSGGEGRQVPLLCIYSVDPDIGERNGCFSGELTIEITVADFQRLHEELASQP